jgi:anti-sigma factor RsiW
MRCEDFEMSIYIYSELSAKEKKRLDSHLETCATCSALFQEVKQVQHLVSGIAEEELIPSNAARLTSGIMSKINAESSRTEPFIARLFVRARFALTVLSSVLLITFAVEFFRDSPQTKSIVDDNTNGSIVLNAKHFRENFSRGKATHALFADCKSPFRSNQYYVECIKSKMK